MSLDYNQIVARFFAARVGLLTNARRVIVLTQVRFMAYDESDVIKETHPYTDLLEITPSKLKPDEFIIQWQGGSKETYVCPHRNYLISSMIRLNEINKKVKPVKYRAFQLTRAGERFECSVAVGGASIDKYETNSDRQISSRWLMDISRVFKFTRERDHGIEVRYLDGTFHQYSFSSEDRANILAALRKSVSGNFGNELFIEEVTYEDLASTHTGDQDAMLSELSQERVIYDTLVTMESKKRPNKPKNVHLRLTMSKILLEHESNKFLAFARSVTSVIKMRSYGDNDDKFTIEFADGKVCVFHSAQKELILTSILDLAKWNNHKNLCLMYGDSANGSKVGTPTSEYNPDWTFYFLRRTSSLTEKTEPNELQFIVDEFNQNIPLVGDTIKDKKVIYVFFGLLKLYVPYQATSRRIVMSLLNGIHRSLSFRGSFDEVTRIPNCMPSLLGFIQQTTDECVSYASSFVLNAMSVGNGQSPKSEAANKEIIYTGENTAALLAMLMRNSDAKLNPLLVSALLSMLESTLSLNAHSTPREVARKLLSNFFSYVEIIFQLCRFPCTSIVKSTSIVLYVLMKNCDDKMFKRIQDLARSTMGLLWQIRLAFDSPLQEQRQVSWDLVIMMVDGNNESLKLLQRMFPADLIRELTGDGTLKPRFANKNPQAMMQQPQTPNQPQQNGYAWEKFFECLQQNYETPTLIWNGSLRYELVFAIGQELGEFDKEKEMNPNKKYVWNYEEFTIKYMSIANELKVGNYYINILLKRLPNVTITNATLFLEKLFYRLISESINENRISYLKAMTWCYAQYHEEIGRIHFMDNLVYMLQSWTNPAVLGSLLAFLLELFVLNDNIASFLDYGGATEITRILTLLHLPQPSKKVNPLQIGSVCLKLLARLMLTQQSSIDENGNIKIPIPRLKRQLSEKVQLQAIVSIFLAGSEGLGAQLAEQAAGILEYITDYNEAVIGNIYQTGLFYFAFFYQGYATEQNFIKLAKLVAKLHLRQLHTPGVSILKPLLPPTLLEVLEQQGYDAFSKKFFGDIVSEDLVWNKACRKYMAEEIGKHIQEYRGRIRGSAKSVGYFDWKPMPEIVYDFEYLKNVVVVDSPRKEVEPIKDDMLKKSMDVKIKEETPAPVVVDTKRTDDEQTKKEEQAKKEAAAAKLEEELKNQVAEEEKKRKEEQEKAEEERKKQEVEFLKEEQRRKLEDERRQIEEERKRINDERQRMDEEKKRSEESRLLDAERRKLEEERREIEEAKKAIEAEKRRVEDEKLRKLQDEENLKQQEEREKAEAAQRKKEEEQQQLRAEEEKQRIALEEERKKLEEERRKLGEQQQRQQEEEKKKKEDDIREALRTMEEERKRIEEERKTIEEEKRKMEEEKKRKEEEEERKRFEEEKRQVEEEKKKLEDNKKKNEQDILSQLEEQRKFIEEEKRRLEEEKRQIEEERKKREAANQTKLFGFLPTKQTKP